MTPAWHAHNQIKYHLTSWINLLFIEKSLTDARQKRFHRLNKPITNKHGYIYTSRTSRKWSGVDFWSEGCSDPPSHPPTVWPTFPPRQKNSIFHSIPPFFLHQNFLRTRKCLVLFEPGDLTTAGLGKRYDSWEPRL